MSDTQPVDLEPVAGPPKPAYDPSTAMRWLLATLSFGAGAVHLVMVPAHAAESLRIGLAFAAVGWFQLAFGVAILAAPKKLWVQLTIAANVVFIAAWALSRTVGLPAWTGDAGVEKATSPDILCVAFEAAIVVACVALLLAPDMLKRWKQSALVVAAIVPAAILVATTAVLASPSTANHAHGDGGDHGHGAETASGPMDHGAMDHGQSGPMDHAAMDHGNRATAVPASARCDWALNTQAFWEQNPPAQSGASGSHTDHEHASGTGAGTGQGNGHGAQAWTPITDKAQCDELRTDIDRMEEVAKKYPTAQDAMNAGCFRVVVYVPGIGAHYICPKNFGASPNIDKPEMILYGGSQPWAPIVGLSYYSLAQTSPSDDPNAALWVKYMPRHYHQGLCIKGGQVVGGDNSDAAQCEAKGGKVQGKTGWMGHYWLPSCDSPDGVFSADNPRLDAGVGTYNDDPANATDPGKLQANPCTGSKLNGAGGSTFGPPPTVDAKSGESGRALTTNTRISTRSW